MRAVSILLTIIILAIVAIAAIYIYNPNLIYNLLGISNDVYVSGVSVEINSVNPISCFGSVVQPFPGFYTEKGSQFQYMFNLSNSCPASHNVTTINVLNNNFAVQVTDPKLPYEIFSNNRVPFKLLITPTSSFNGGVLTLQVNVT
jgi:hypothetical protein